MEQAEIDQIIEERREDLFFARRRARAMNNLQPADADVCEIDFELHMRDSVRLAIWRSTHFSLGWLKTCAQHFVANYRRGLDIVRDHERVDEVIQTEAALRETRKHGPDQKTQAAEIKRELQAALEALPEKQRVMITMHHSEQRTYAEIAEESGTTPEAVRKSIGSCMVSIPP